MIDVDRQPGGWRRGVVLQSQPVVTGLVALVIAVAAGVWFGGRPVEPPPLLVDAAPAGSGGETITLHVSGAVSRPGLVAVEAGSRVADALLAAGGALEGADLAAINLAAPVIDAMLIVVPFQTAQSGAPSGDGRVRINAASVQEIATLPGIGPVLAERIAAHRDANGPFAVPEDLLDVSGIGESKLESLRDLVIVP